MTYKKNRFAFDFVFRNFFETVWEYGQTIEEVPMHVWLNPETFSLLISVPDTQAGLTKTPKLFNGKVFLPKEETHITIVNRDLARTLKGYALANDSFQEALANLVNNTDWSYEIGTEHLHFAKEKEIALSDGKLSKICAESIVVKASVPGIQGFYEELGRLIGRNIEPPWTHVTLYTFGDTEGIRIASKQDFDRYRKGEINLDTLDEAPRPNRQKEIDLTRLYEILYDYFDRSDIRQLCFNMGIDSQELAGERKSEKVIELVQYCTRRDRIQELVEEIRKMRDIDFES